MNNWVHIIGIAGVTTAGLAYAFKAKGYKVTGSDKGFYPPVSDFLKKHEIKIEPGFNKDRLTIDGKHPDLIIYQGTKSIKNNEEIAEAINLGLKLTTYPQVLVDQIIKKGKSIVVTGSFGKTTTTVLLTSIFSQAQIPHSFMYGAFGNELDPNVRFKDDTTRYSIVEGDEYLDSLENRVSKFFYYAPQYLIITGLEWDHQDLFPSFESYLSNFKKLVEMVPENGLIIANGDDPNLRKVLEFSKAKILYCSSQPQSQSDWYLINDSHPQRVLMRKNANEEIIMIPYDRSVLGKYNDKNILYAAALAYELNIPKEAIQKGISSFKGLKRRLEIRWQTESNLIIDDFGSTPAKLRTALNELKEEYPNKKIYAVIDPAAGSRSNKALAEFRDHIPQDIKVILPKFSFLPRSDEGRYSEQDLRDLILKEGKECMIIDSDVTLLQYLTDKLQNEMDLLVVFLGSHSFRGMITKLVDSLR